MKISMCAARYVAKTLSTVVADDQWPIRFIDPILICRIDNEIGEIEWTPKHRLAAVQRDPGLASVIRSVESVFWWLCFNECIDNVALRRSHCHCHSTPGFGRQAFSGFVVKFSPGGTTVGTAEQTASTGSVGAVSTGAECPALTTKVPHTCVDS